MATVNWHIKAFRGHSKIQLIVVPVLTRLCLQPDDLIPDFVVGEQNNLPVSEVITADFEDWHTIGHIETDQHVVEYHELWIFRRTWNGWRNTDEQSGEI